jgi:hypothetical protein
MSEENKQIIVITFKEEGSADAQIEVTATITPEQVWAVSKKLDFLASQTAQENRFRRLMEMEQEEQRKKIMTPDMALKSDPRIN